MLLFLACVEARGELGGSFEPKAHTKAHQILLDIPIALILTFTLSEPGPGLHINLK
jgi:hypothetical protein